MDILFSMQLSFASSVMRFDMTPNGVFFLLSILCFLFSLNPLFVRCVFQEVHLLNYLLLNIISVKKNMLTLVYKF